MPSWHPQSKPYPSTPTNLTFDAEIHPSRTPSLLTSTCASLPGHIILRTTGTVHGTTSLARKDTKSFIKNIAASFSGGWGEPKSVTSAIYSARDQAVERMVKEAVSQGANAIVGVVVRESEVLGCVVVSCSGTACWVERERGTGGVKRDSAQATDPFV
jgi:uncharacterized protein YbjQ (UPF0145 family)